MNMTNPVIYVLKTIEKGARPLTVFIVHHANVQLRHNTHTQKYKYNAESALLLIKTTLKKHKNWAIKDNKNKEILEPMITNRV